MISLYQHRHGGADHPVGVSGFSDFSVNISPILPPGVLEGLDRLPLDRYPSIDGAGVRDFYVGRFGLDPEMVLSLNGAVEGLYLLPRALAVRRAALFSPSFHEYERAVLAAGAEVKQIRLQPGRGFALPPFEELVRDMEDVDALMAGNPGNPTGTVLPPDVVLALACRFPEKWFIVDEAFIQFTPEFPVNSLMQHLQALKNVVVVHSLTKFYALPALRFGALVAHPATISHLLQFKEPWSVNLIAETVARRLLSCREYEDELLAMVVAERQRIAHELAGSPTLALEGGAANFFLARWRGGCSVDLLLSRLAAAGVPVRDCRNFRGLEDGYFRFAVRTPPENDRLLAMLSA